MAAMSVHRYGHTAESIDTKIYVIGGERFLEGSDTHCMEVYDCKLDSWEVLDQPTNFMFSTSTTY